jgi:hypothetical protein
VVVVGVGIHVLLTQIMTGPPSCLQSPSLQQEDVLTSHVGGLPEQSPDRQYEGFPELHDVPSCPLQV